MTDVTARNSIPFSAAKLLDTSKLKQSHISEAPDGVYRRLVQGLERMLEMRHSQSPDLSNNPTYQPYGEVTVNGKVVAKINNHGFVETSNALGAMIGDGLPGEVNGKSGPDLAQARADHLANLLGGRVEKSATALTQRQFEGIPQPKSRIDFTAMQQDPAYESLMKIKEARTLFLTQQLSSGAG